MGSSFRTRIFRLLLLFAVVPAVLLTIVGYYLVVESPLRTGTAQPADTSPLTSYHHEVLDDILRNDLQTFARTRDTSLLSCDVLIESTDDSLVLLLDRAAMSEDIRARVEQSVANRTRGLAVCDSVLFQFVSYPHERPRYVAGLFHPPAYVALVEDLRRQSAAQSTHAGIRSAYFVFIGGLFVAIAVLAILVAYLLSARASRHISRPLILLSEASQRIAAGEFRQKVPVEGDREIQTLITNFNAMAESLDSMTSQLAQAERVAAWRQVARRFAHELKNPLQPILVSLYRIEKLLAASDDWGKVKEPLQAASEEVKHLTSLADRFSHLAKLPAPETEQVNIVQLVDQVREIYTGKLGYLRFTTEISEDTAIILTDKTYLREILHNLIQNAIDACRDGDSIVVSADRINNTCRISVTDTGRGMDEATLASARLPYYTTKSHGTGLGLAIVERAVTEMGGRLAVASTPQVGTAITITLPQEMPDDRHRSDS